MEDRISALERRLERHSFALWVCGGFMIGNFLSMILVIWPAVMRQ